MNTRRFSLLGCWYSAFVVTLYPATLVAQAVIELEVNHTATDADDYIGWAPVAARARLLTPGADRPVVIRSTKRGAADKKGEVQFAEFSTSRPTPATFQPQDSLNLTIPGSGAWKSFWVAGKESSSDGRDVSILVGDPGASATIHEHPLMVRVRKNAEDLSDVEITRFLEALAALHNVANSGQNSRYVKYVHVHGTAFSGAIHGGPAFGPWHRTMLLSLERELQSIDPRVAIPYWKFDANAPRLFRREFIGRVVNNSVFVTFADGNPIRGWRMPSNAAIANMTTNGPIPMSTEPLERLRNAGSSHPTVFLEDVLDQSEYGLMREFLEFSYHGAAHNHIGAWMASIESPKDPLFFLLHANVDRAWALWQKEEGAFNGDNNTAYSPQDSYPGPGAEFLQGSYADDSQWPWDLKGGNQGNTDPGDDWPAFEFSLTAGPADHGPSTLPIVKELVDYEDVQGNGLPVGFSYDTIKWAN